MMKGMGMKGGGAGRGLARGWGAWLVAWAFAAACMAQTFEPPERTPDGFLVPLKSNGGIYAVRIDPQDVTKTTGTVKISAKKDGYFYHMGYWVDLNGDGRKDYITARSNA